MNTYTHTVAVVLTLALIGITGQSGQAQTAMNVYPNGRLSQTESLTRDSFGGPSFDNTVDFLTHKAEAEEEERAAREKRLRSLGAYGNRYFVPSQRETYFERQEMTAPHSR